MLTPFNSLSEDGKPESSMLNCLSRRGLRKRDVVKRRDEGRKRDRESWRDWRERRENKRLLK